MNKQQYTIDINAPREKVWAILWQDDAYRKWTAAFAEGSHAISDWNEGSKVLFLGEGGAGGMVSRIAKMVPNEFMSFEHLGEVRDGIEDTESDRVKQWAGAHENYTLTEENGVTRLVVEIDLSDEFAEMFKEMWPKALANIKALAG